MRRLGIMRLASLDDDFAIFRSALTAATLLL